jgi:hypothetical protein
MRLLLLVWRFRWRALGIGILLVLIAVVAQSRSQLADESERLADANATLSKVRANEARLTGQTKLALVASEARLARLQQNLAVERERVAELRRVSPYPRGAFDWCPSVAGTHVVNATAASEAGSIAVAFDLALHQRAMRLLARLEDPTISHDALVSHPKRVVLDPGYWAMTALARGVRVVGGGAGSRDGLASYGCGRAVAARSWIVALHDASNTASAGGASFFLVHRHTGWKVWGSY